MTRFMIKSLVIALMLSFTASAFAGGKVLLVQSYHEGYAWTDAITEGVEQALEGTGVELEVFYMDTKRKTSNEWKVESGNLAKARVDQFKPDVVITGDDNAQEYFAKAYAGIEGAPQVVFCGVNAVPEKYGYPAANVTGILERAHVVDSVKMLMQFNSGISKIAILTDKSTTSDAVVDYVKTLNIPVEVVSIDQPTTFAEWQATVQKYQSTVDAIGVNMYHTVKRDASAEESMDPAEVIAWTVANNKLPSFSFLPLGVDDGVLCAIAESGVEHGLEAAGLALECINNGKAAGDMPIRTAKKGQIMFNVATAEKMGIEIPFDMLKMADKVVESQASASAQ